ncbi:MAG TPA: dTDP-glucose 4,6-dehydratase [Candidatus Margulisiibacteriota bacterium]|nr:dTDP-glucose 4,6-dehydratase [Candidatus Margulisiibacteriota bacterium]
MRRRLPKILITGGAGFIGSAFTRLYASYGFKLAVLDKLTYAGDLSRLRDVKSKIKFYRADIADQEKVEEAFKQVRPDILLNFAAESHVDRSIKDPSPFLKTNILGVEVLLGAVKKFPVDKFVHISTDEVYGDIEKGSFTESSPLKPSSPYAASKAAADLFINSYSRTHGVSTTVIRPSNNYGPWQYPEKLIPLTILKILQGKKVPVYAKGENIREWLYVEDCAEAIFALIGQGRRGEVYNLGSSREIRNIEVVRMILGIMGVSPKRIEFVKDRPGHDIRYRLNSAKLYKALGWRPRVKFEDGLKMTVWWYLEHKDWLLSKAAEIEKLYE